MSGAEGCRSLDPLIWVGLAVYLKLTTRLCLGSG